MVGKPHAASRHCFLETPLHIKKYQILKPFTHVGTFQTTDLRKRFNKALLDNSSFERQCIFCYGFFKDLLQHQQFYWHGLSRERTKLFDALYWKVRNQIIVSI